MSEDEAWSTSSLPELPVLPEALDVAAIGARASQELAHACGTDIAFLAVHDAPGQLHMRGTFGVHTASLRVLEIPRGVGLGGRVLVSGRPLHVWDYATDDSISHELVQVVSGGEGIGALAGVPVMLQGRTLGVLYTALRRPGDLGDRRLLTMETRAADLAQVLLPALQTQDLLRQSVLAERQRLAVELHDTIGQLLFGIGASARAALLAAESATRDRWVEVERQASQAASLLRTALAALSPHTQTDAFLAAARGDVDDFERRTGIAASLITVGGLAELSADITAALVRTVRVALDNICRHADASSVVVSAWRQAEAVVVTVQDDGVGPPPGLQPPATVPLGGSGLGLAALRQQVERLRGTLEIFANDDGGTTVRVRIPVSDPGRRSA